MYDPQMVQPFRDELTSIGVKELLTSEDVDTAVKASGTTLVFVNSVCGCAAGSAAQRVLEGSEAPRASGRLGVTEVRGPPLRGPTRASLGSEGRL